MIKYENEINDFIRSIYEQDELTSSEMTFDEFKEEVFKEMGVNMQHLSDQIEVGVKNGFSVETQFKLGRLLAE